MKTNVIGFKLIYVEWEMLCVMGIEVGLECSSENDVKQK